MLGIPLVVAAIAAATYFAVRDGDANGATGTTAGTDTTTTNPTTTTSTTSTTVAPLSPEDEIRRAAADLFELRDEVLQNPDPNRILEYCEDQSPLYAMDVDTINRLIAQNARWGGDPGQVLGVRLESFDPRSPQLAIVSESAPVDIIDANGHVVQHLSGGRSAYSISLLGSAGNWKINRFLVLDQIEPDAVEQIIMLGVP
ncbi:MAG: hypothetical protein ACRD29_05850 [Acidimicrobiales bacterium]